MNTVRILKISLRILIALCFIITFCFVAACTKAEPSEAKEDSVKIEETTEEETVIPEEVEETEEKESEEIVEEEETEALMIVSPAFSENEKVPVKFTCDADNINPQLDISGVPKVATSLVLIVDDPDAPGGTWVHWTMWNIDPTTTSISENSVPIGAVEGRTDFGAPGYGGPCPPSGTHRYFFKIFALDITLDLDPSATAADVESAIQGHVVDSAELIGLYGE